jgi:hypothetical protein
LSKEGVNQMRQLAVLAALGCVAALSSGCGMVSSRADGQVTTYQGYGGTAIVSADGRTITVGPYLPSCPAKVAVVARESATHVALFVRYITPAHPGPCPQAMAALVVSQKISLRAPVGSRKLTDGGTGRAIAWISARFVLRPKALPAGLRLFQLIPAIDRSRPQSPGPAGCTQFYSRRGVPDDLEIVQSAGSLQIPGPGSGGWKVIRVRGHLGRATRNLITWREDGLRNYLLAGPGTQGRQALSTGQLIAIADSSLTG